MRSLVQLLSLLAAALVLWLIFYGTPKLIHQVLTDRDDDPVQVSHGYEDRVFDGVLVHEGLLSSRYTPGSPKEECRHVFVQLPSDAPLKPPRSIATRDRDFRFGGIWRRTPVALGDTAFESVNRCIEFLGDKLAAMLRRALTSDGGYYYRDLTDGTLHIYAPQSRIAGRISIAPVWQRSP